LRPHFWLALLPALSGAADLRGVIDLHVHAAPDVMARSVDGIDAARLARTGGLRAIVLKNHYEPTVSWAHFAAKSISGREVFGGIALNRAVGGVNPAAVSRMAQVRGGRGRVAWMPTFDAENHVRYNGESRPSVAISRAGRLLPEVLEVLDLIRQHGLLLATGHSTLRGNIAAEFRALLDAWPEAVLVYVPAYPKLGRTVRNGELYVDGRPLAETAFAQDRLNPSPEGSIPNLLVRGGCRSVAMAQSAGRLPDLIAQVAAGAVVVCDGQVEADLK